ncbi:hypothetical protein BGZ58_001960 [Dissophora ornata]|nr:hypothetical protein BGZ58_001960 [Dissophora ornata]
MRPGVQSLYGELRTTFYNPHEVKRRRRTSRSQLKTLEKAFSENPKPDANARLLLAQKLSMKPRWIQVWFQNRRAKNKQVNATTNTSNSIQRDTSGFAHDHPSSPHPVRHDNALFSEMFFTGSGRLDQQNAEIGLNTDNTGEDSQRGSLNPHTGQTTFAADPSSQSRQPVAESTQRSLSTSPHLTHHHRRLSELQQALHAVNAIGVSPHHNDTNSATPLIVGPKSGCLRRLTSLEQGKWIQGYA